MKSSKIKKKTFSFELKMNENLKKKLYLRLEPCKRIKWF